MKTRDLTGLPLALRLTQEASGNPLTDPEGPGRDLDELVTTAEDRARTVARLDRLRRNDATPARFPGTLVATYTRRWDHAAGGPVLRVEPEAEP